MSEKEIINNLSEILFRHDERMNELQAISKNHEERMNRMAVSIERLDRQADEHRDQFNEFMKWARARDERNKNSDARFESLIASLYESQITSSARMDRLEMNLGRLEQNLGRLEKNLGRLEKNLDLLIESMRGGRNGKDGR
jgi:chromosome segregation ATPase